MRITEFENPKVQAKRKLLVYKKKFSFLINFLL